MRNSRLLGHSPPRRGFPSGAWPAPAARGAFHPLHRSLVIAVCGLNSERCPWIVFSLTVQPENGPRFCLVARFTRFERSAQRDRALRRKLERVKGIEPSYAAWEAAVLPLNYTRDISAAVALPIALLPGNHVVGNRRAFLELLVAVVAHGVVLPMLNEPQPTRGCCGARKSSYCSSKVMTLS
jgi:hypothetical protein